MKKLMLCCCFVFLMSCTYDAKDHIPGEQEIFSVSDMYLFEDGAHLMILNSNLNRAYDYSRLSVLGIDDENNKNNVVSSVLLEPLGGKFIVSSDEKSVFVTTRDKGLLYKIDIIKKADGTINLKEPDDSSVLDMQKEPYALAFGRDEKYIAVTHIANGEVLVIDSLNMDIKNIFKLNNGVVDIIYDEDLNVFVSVHKNKSFMTVFRLIHESDERVSVIRSMVDIPVPTPGNDIRSVIPAENPGEYFISYRNTHSGVSFPAVMKVRLYGDIAENLFTEQTAFVPVNGRPAELAVLRNVFGDGNSIFLSDSGSKRIIVTDDFYESIVAEIEFDECRPYPLYSRPEILPDTVFVSCFRNDFIKRIDRIQDDSFLHYEISEVIR